MSELTNNRQTELLESINEKLDKIIQLLSNTNVNTLVAPDDVFWSSYKNSIIVYGNTIPVKEHLKKVGGKWNSKLKGWYFRSTKFNSLSHNIKNVEKEFSSSDSE
jgi:hypothetical protein